MNRYVDGYVLPVPKKNLAAYKRMAQKAGQVWRDHGALEYVECVADDVKPGKWTSFPQSAKEPLIHSRVAATVAFRDAEREARRSE